MNKIFKSIKIKILLVLALVFLMLMIATTLISTYNEREMVLELAVDKTLQIATTYFDNVNTMMLSGTMAQRSVLREKLLEGDHITQAKIIRADAVKKLFGPGNAEQIIEDDLDRQGLNSKDAIIIKHDDGGKRSVTVIKPMFARKAICLGPYASIIRCKGWIKSSMQICGIYH
jgi:methyl-accepting chemotaxis protein